MTKKASTLLWLCLGSRHSTTKAYKSAMAHTDMSQPTSQRLCQTAHQMQHLDWGGFALQRHVAATQSLFDIDQLEKAQMVTCLVVAMSLRVWKTLHVQKQIRSHISSHRDTRMGNAIVWLMHCNTTVCRTLWRYLVLGLGSAISYMCGARQHCVASSKYIFFNTLVVENCLWPCISRSKHAFSRQSSNHEVQHSDLTQSYAITVFIFSDGVCLWDCAVFWGVHNDPSASLPPQRLLVMTWEATANRGSTRKVYVLKKSKAARSKASSLRNKHISPKLGRLAGGQTLRCSRDHQPVNLPGHP